jgi:hypothetical protein
MTLPGKRYAAYAKVVTVPKLQNAKAMPDRVPLFALQVCDREQLLSSLKSRGLDPCPPANKLSN